MRRSRPEPARPPPRAAASPSKPAVRRTLTIESLGAQGDGWAPDARAHVAFTLPGEIVVADVSGDRGELVEVLEPSPLRVPPPCPHFGVCGGCALQHMEPAAYVGWKVEPLRQTLAREGIEAPFDAALRLRAGQRAGASRCMRARAGRRAARLGYKARRSWSLVEVEVCPIADPRLVAAFPALRRLAAPLMEHPASAPDPARHPDRDGDRRRHHPAWKPRAAASPPTRGCGWRRSRARAASRG